MDAPEIARQYAEAIYGLGQDQRCLASLEQEVEQFLQLFCQEEDLRVFLESPLISAGAKKTVLAKGLEGQVSEILLHFLYLLADKQRFLILPEIAAAFRALLDEKEGRARAQVTTAREVDRELMQLISQAIAGKIGRQIVIKHQVNPELIGGIVLRIGDIQVDGSIKNRLGKYRKVLMEKKQL